MLFLTIGLAVIVIIMLARINHKMSALVGQQQQLAEQLADSLTHIAESLDSISGSLERIDVSLKNIEVSLKSIDGSLTSIDGTLTEAQKQLRGAPAPPQLLPPQHPHHDNQP